MGAEEKINQELKERIDEMEEMIDLYRLNPEAAIERANEWIAAYEDDTLYRGKRLELSWGGPADGFIFLENGRVIYYYADWYDEAEKDLYGDDKEVAETFKEIFLPEEEGI